MIAHKAWGVFGWSFQGTISLNSHCCWWISSRLIVLSTWWFVHQCLASEFLSKITQLLHKILLWISYNFFRLPSHRKCDVTIFWYKAIINCFGPQILNAGYPFISVCLILCPKYKFSIALFILILLFPCTCANL